MQFTQSRAGAKAKELETEEHMFRLSELAVNRIREDAKKMEKEEVTLNDKMTTLQTQLHLGGEKLDQFKLTMNWNQEELEQWAEASRQKEEDNLALEKYKRAGDARVRELNLAIEKMTKAVNAKREALENEVTDTQAAQLELDRAAEDFRALHSERQDLVRQWEDTIETMKRRDQAIRRRREPSRLGERRSDEAGGAGGASAVSRAGGCQQQGARRGDQRLGPRHGEAPRRVQRRARGTARTVR